MSLLLMQIVVLLAQVVDVDMCRPNTYPHCHSWGACSKPCGGGRRSRICESCVLYQDKRFYEDCNEFCRYGHSYYSGRCHCPSWRYGECCEHCRHINIPHCVSGQQICGGSPDNIKCTQCHDPYYPAGYGNGCRECTPIRDCRNLTCTDALNSKCKKCVPGKAVSVDGKSCIDMAGVRIKCFDTCLIIFQRKQTWENAEAVCEARGGHLFVPETSQEESIVSNYLEAAFSNGRHTSFWIGGKILTTNKEQWISDTVVNHHWGLTKPTATNEPLCIAMDPDQSFSWTAFSCNTPSFFLCEEK